jgi:hypothetical protein
LGDAFTPAPGVSAGAAAVGLPTSGAVISLTTGAGSEFAGAASAKDGTVIAATTINIFFNIFINLAP